MQFHVRNAILNLLLLAKVLFFLADPRLLDTGNKENAASVSDWLLVPPHLAWREGGFNCELNMHCHTPLPILTLFMMAQTLSFFADPRLRDIRNPWRQLFNCDCLSLEFNTWLDVQYYWSILSHGQTETSFEGGGCHEVL